MRQLLDSINIAPPYLYAEFSLNEQFTIWQSSPSINIAPAICALLVLKVESVILQLFPFNNIVPLSLAVF